MKRYFNTTGFCRPDWHYMINPLRGFEHEIKNLIEDKQYFLLHSPRQTEKRLKWQDTSFIRQDIKRDITIVEM